MDRKPSYNAVIPSPIRYDDRLPANAKLLYGEIDALADQDGICYAGNEYFASCYSVTERSISNLLHKLEDCGYIQIRQNNSVRFIVLTDAVLHPDPRIVSGETRKIFSAYMENIFHDLEKNFRGNDSNNIYISPLSPPKNGTQETPPKKRKHRNDYREQAEHEPERFERFWRYYNSVVPAGKAGNRQAAIRAWDNLQPDAALIRRMGKALKEQVQTEDWQDGIGIKHASTWINKHAWEDLDAADQADEPEQREASGWD